MPTSKKEHTPMPKFILHETIFFLRPQSEEAVEVVNAKENDPYRFQFAPPNEPTDQRSGEVFDEDFASSGESGEQLSGKMSEAAPQTHNPPNPVSTGSSRGACGTYPFVLRFGFDSVENPSKEGFTFGTTPGCEVQLLRLEAKNHFRILYNSIVVHY